MGSELRVRLAEDGADSAPPGARAFDVAAVGGLLVGLGSSAEGLLAVVSAVRRWLTRGNGIRRTVRLEIGRGALGLSEASSAGEERLIDVFIRRHAAPDVT